MLTIITLGSGDESLLPPVSSAELRKAKRLVFRTGKHPIAANLAKEGVPFETFDELYEMEEDFDRLNEKASERLLTLLESGDVCYAVSDPLTDGTVSAVLNGLKDPSGYTILPGVTHAQRCLSLLNTNASGIRLVSASDFASFPVRPSEPVLITELHSRECAGDCKLKLLSIMPEEMTVTLIRAKNNGVTLIREDLPLYEIDRRTSYDHLTALYVPGVPYLKRERFTMDDLMTVVGRLRAPDGCPWDREQTHESLLPDLLEESYEYIQAVRDGDIDHMYDELGDVLLQIALHAEIARQYGEFDIDDVTSAVCGKMIARHTHVFGNVKADTSDDVLANWEQFKRKERGIQTHTDAMRSVSTALSPLMRARKLQNKAHKVGFDFDSPRQALEKVQEEAGEVLDNFINQQDPAEELGDLLFSVVNVCRLAGIDPDIAMNQATEKFINRFEKLENAVLKDGKSLEDLTISEMDVYWKQIKKCMD